MNKQHTNKPKTKPKNKSHRKPYVASDDYFEFGEYLDLSSKEINKNVHNLKIYVI